MAMRQFAIWQRAKDKSSPEGSCWAFSRRYVEAKHFVYAEKEKEGNEGCEEAMVILEAFVCVPRDAMVAGPRGRLWIHLFITFHDCECQPVKSRRLSLYSLVLSWDQRLCTYTP
nr:hypothetical protein CFP56_16877 [Quercus suber]